MSPNLAGSLFMVLAMLGFAVEDAFFKAATLSVSPGFATIQFGLTGLVIFAMIARVQGQPAWTPRYLHRPLMIRTGFEVTGRLFFALALAYTPLSTTSAILQAAPLVVTLGAVLFLGERVGPRRWIAMGVGFLGVLVILRPTPEGVEASALFAVLGMIGFAGRDLLTRASPPEVPSSQLGVLGFAGVAIAGLVIALFEAAPRPPDVRAALLICGTSVAGVLAYEALTRAMRTGEVSVVAPFRYARLLFALIFAYAAFGERPDALMLCGAALIVGSGIYTLWRGGSGGGRRSALKPRA